MIHISGGGGSVRTGIAGIVIASMWLGVCGTARAEKRYPVFRLEATPEVKTDAYEKAVWQNIPWATGFFKLSTSRKVKEGIPAQFHGSVLEQDIHAARRCAYGQPKYRGYGELTARMQSRLFDSLSNG